MARSASTRSMAGGFPYLVAEVDGGIARLCLCRAFPRRARPIASSSRIRSMSRRRPRAAASAALLMQRLIAEAQSAGLSPDHRRHRRRPPGQRVGQAARGARLSPFRPPGRLRLQARTLARHGLHAAVDEWRRRRADPIRPRCRSGSSRASPDRSGRSGRGCSGLDQLQRLVEDARARGRVHGRASGCRPLAATTE